MHNDPVSGGLKNIMARMDGLWERFRGQSVFITGGTGLFGRWLLESLVHANRTLHLDLSVTVLTRNASAFLEQAPHFAQDRTILFHAGDVKDFSFPDGHYPFVIHGATTSAAETFNGETPLRKFDTLVCGTRRVLDFAVHCSAKRMLFLSSGVAYGVQPAGMDFIPEDYMGAPDPADVDSALGEAKRAAELLCACYAKEHALDYSVARCFSFIGPFLPLDIHYAIGNFIRQALFEGEIIVKGDGSPIRSYMYMADLVVWMLTLLLLGKSNEIYNVGSDEAISIKNLAYLVCDTLDTRKEVVILGKPDYSVGNVIRNSYVPDISKARRELELEAWTPLVEAIRMTGLYYASAKNPPTLKYN